MITDYSHFAKEDEAVSYYFNYYRKHGYPKYDIANYDPEKELKKLIKFDEQSIRNGQDLKQTMHSCGYLWCYFPHWVTVSTYNDKSLMDNWNDDDKLTALIRKTIRWNVKHNHGIWTTNRIRQNAKVYCSKQTVSNFRPTVAKYIYNTYGSKGAVYDPCGGWGGRMFGFMASDCHEYVCCEPSTNTYLGLLNLAANHLHPNKDISIHHACAESFIPQANHFNLVFTSPPYFDTEHYSDEPTQSCIAYPTYEQWLVHFLYRLIDNACTALVDDGYFILNIANTAHATTVEQDACVYAETHGFTLMETLWLTLSSIAGKGVKREPVFVFKKSI